MHIADAMEIVLCLARGNQLDRHETCYDAELDAEAKRQQEAFTLVEDFVVNHLGDDGEDEIGPHVWKGASIVDDCSLCGERYAHPSHHAGKDERYGN